MDTYYFPGPNPVFYPSIVIDGKSLEGIPGTVRELEPDQVPADGLWFKVSPTFVPPEANSAAPESGREPDPTPDKGEADSGAPDPSPAHAEDHSEAGASAPAHPFLLGQEG